MAVIKPVKIGVKEKLKGYDFFGIKKENNYLLKEEQVLNALIEFKNNNKWGRVHSAQFSVQISISDLFGQVA